MLLLLTQKRKKMIIMAYYFAVETKQNNYDAINIKRSREYSHNAYTYDNPFACTLKEIDKITTTFKNEEELRLALINCYSLNSKNFDKTFTIFYKEGKESRLIPNSILYENSRELLEEPSKIGEYIKKSYKENNLDFFKELLNQYDDSLITYQIKQIISTIEYNITAKNFYVKQVICEEDLDSCIKFLMYNYTTDKDGLIRFSKTPNYKKLHNLVALISNYELTLNKDKTSNKKRVKIKENTSK